MAHLNKEPLNKEPLNKEPLNDEPLIVACAADAHYAMPLAVTACSMMANLEAGRKVELYVLDGGLTPAQRQRIVRSIDSYRIQIHWVCPSDAMLWQLPISQKYPISIYYRLLLPQIIPQSVKKVIYLDTDLIIKRDLGQLWDLDIRENCVLAVQDACQRYISATSHINYKKLGISEDCKYFNTGVLVIHLEKWRAEHISEQTIEFLRQHSEDVLFPDQDALNVVLAGKWGELDPRWNQVHVVHDYSAWQESPYSEQVYQAVLHDPYIVHFTTPPKPWNKGCTHPERGLFFQYLDQTAWRGWRNTLWRRAWRKVSRILPSVRSHHKRYDVATSSH